MGGLLGENGGGLFVLAYLACTIFIGLPIMIVETLMGRMTQSYLACSAGPRRGWSPPPP